jgi:Predicted metal binding domain
VADPVVDPTPAAGTLTLVPLAVSAAKLAAELMDWDTNADLYARRGWLLLERGELHVVVAFIAPVTLVGDVTIPVITACVRIDYTNYDLWAPSVTFVDPRTREPARPAVRAPYPEADGPRDSLIDGHPITGRPFLCLPGIREYHEHPQHSGDDWLLHRASGAGRLAVISERIWQRMVRSVMGLQVMVQALPAPIGTQVQVGLAQGTPMDAAPHAGQADDDPQDTQSAQARAS